MAAVLLLAGLTGACGDDPSSSPPNTAAPSATTTATSAPTTRIEASAALTVGYGGEERALELTQDQTSAGTFYPGDPLRVEFATRTELDLFALTGPIRPGVQQSSEDLVVALEVTFGDEFVFLYSSDEECVVTVNRLDPPSVEGTVECDASFEGQPLKASGRFRATEP